MLSVLAFHRSCHGALSILDNLLFPMVIPRCSFSSFNLLRFFDLRSVSLTVLKVSCAFSWPFSLLSFFTNSCWLAKKLDPLLSLICQFFVIFSPHLFVLILCKFKYLSSRLVSLSRLWHQSFPRKNVFLLHCFWNNRATAVSNKFHLRV